MNLWIKKNIGWLTILVLAVLPVIRWFFMLPMDIRFFDFNAMTTSLGQIAGLLGLALFSLNLILASRLKFLDNYFYGLNRVYTYHRAVGSVAFSLLLFHPLFLVVKYLQFSLREAALFLLPFTGDSAATYGIIALVLMIILLATTFYAKIKYQHWKISHKFMTAVFVFALLHVILIQSDISRDLILRVYVLTLAFIGLIAGSYRAWLNKFFNQDFTYKVINLNWPNPSVVEIELRAAGRIMNFQPGQFAFLRFKGAAISGESHPFSLSSAPVGKNLKFLIKSLGDYTSQLGDLKPGDLASIEGPFGRFSYKNAMSNQQIWLAGGIGITPFLSMAGDLKGSGYKIDLYYSVKDMSEAVFLKQLEEISRSDSNFKIIPWLSEEQGRITAEKIFELSRGVNDKEIFICGPVIFMKSLREQFIKLNVPRQRIHREKFDLI